MAESLAWQKKMALHESNEEGYIRLWMNKPARQGKAREATLVLQRTGLKIKSPIDLLLYYNCVDTGKW